MLKPKCFPLLFACFVSVSVVGCSQSIDFSSAVKPTKTTQSLSPEKEEEVSRFITQGNQKLTDGNYEEAIENFNQALAIDKTNAKALGDRGVARSRLEDYQGALKDYNQALAINGEAYEVYYNRGILQTNLKDYEKAVEDFSQAIAYKPNFARAIGNRGFAYAELENYTAAIEDLEKAADIFKERGDKLISYRLQRAALYIQP